MDSNVAFLTSDIGRLFRKRLEVAMRDLGVTGPQWRALSRIDAHPGINQGALAVLLEVEAITAGRMVDRLEKLGLVERRPAPNDRRVWLLHLTERAVPLLEVMRARALSIIAQTTDIFSGAELDLLVSFLKRMREELLEPCADSVEVAAHG